MDTALIAWVSRLIIPVRRPVPRRSAHGYGFPRREGRSTTSRGIRLLGTPCDRGGRRLVRMAAPVSRGRARLLVAQFADRPADLLNLQRNTSSLGREVAAGRSVCGPRRQVAGGLRRRLRHHHQWPRCLDNPLGVAEHVFVPWHPRRRFGAASHDRRSVEQRSTDLRLPCRSGRGLDDCRRNDVSTARSSGLSPAPASRPHMARGAPVRHPHGRRTIWFQDRERQVGPPRQRALEAGSRPAL